MKKIEVLDIRYYADTIEDEKITTKSLMKYATLLIDGYKERIFNIHYMHIIDKKEIKNITLLEQYKPIPENPEEPQFKEEEDLRFFRFYREVDSDEYLNLCKQFRNEYVENMNEYSKQTMI